MTIILSDNLILGFLQAPSPTPWRVEGGYLSKIIVTVFPGKKRRQ